MHPGGMTIKADHRAARIRSATTVDAIAMASTNAARLAMN
jgi:hypothetical protein